MTTSARNEIQAKFVSKVCDVCGVADHNVRRHGLASTPIWRHVQCHAAKIKGAVIATNEPKIAMVQTPEIWQQAGSLTLVLPKGLTREQLTDVGRELAGIARGVQWWIGDWWNHIEKGYGEAETIAATVFPNKTVKTVKNYASIAKAFESSRRRDNLSFTHHDAVAGLDSVLADELLDAAQANDWSAQDLRDEARRRATEFLADEADTFPPSTIAAPQQAISEAPTATIQPPVTENPKPSKPTSPTTGLTIDDNARIRKIMGNLRNHPNREFLCEAIRRLVQSHVFPEFLR